MADLNTILNNIVSDVTGTRGVQFELSQSPNIAFETKKDFEKRIVQLCKDYIYLKTGQTVEQFIYQRRRNTNLLRTIDDVLFEAEYSLTTVRCYEKMSLINLEEHEFHRLLYLWNSQIGRYDIQAAYNIQKGITKDYLKRGF